jgi:Fe-S-cluster containining protein
MFRMVTLQRRDTASVLLAHGMKLKRRKGQQFFEQPCPKFCGSHCSIYDDRPERCQVFECKQLKQVACGKITEATAMETIQEVKRRVAEMERLLNRLGDADSKRPISKRFEKVTAEPLDETSEPVLVRLRSELADAERKLNRMLDDNFRVDND